MANTSAAAGDASIRSTPIAGCWRPGRQTETLRHPCARTLQDVLGAIDQVVNDFTCALALVDHAGNLSTQKRALFVIAVLGGLAKAPVPMAPSSSTLTPAASLLA